MAGDSGDKYQAQQLMAMRNNPDWRYAKMSHTEIENEVIAKSQALMESSHTLPAKSGKQISFNVTEKDVIHLVNDALHRAKGVLLISDISTLPKYFQQAKFIKTEKNKKKPNSGTLFHYYEINMGNRKMYLNIKEDVKHHSTRLHSITTHLQE